MLTAAELTAMREEQEGALPDTCTIKTRSLIGDGQGGQRESHDESSSIACRIAPMSQRQENIYAAKLGNMTGWVFTMPYDTVITVNDRVTCAGQDYEILGSNDGESWETAQRIFCRRLI